MEFISPGTLSVQQNGLTPFGLTQGMHFTAQITFVENKVLITCDPKFSRVENTFECKNGGRNCIVLRFASHADHKLTPSLHSDTARFASAVLVSRQACAEPAPRHLPCSPPSVLLPWARF